MTHAQKLSDLRAVLQKEGVGGFLIPRADEYQGEYVPASSDRMRWISGFTGSAGIAIVMKDKAAVLSDGRYTIQLRQQLDPTLFETDDSTIVPPADWIAKTAKDYVIGYDPRLHTPRDLKNYEDKGIALKPLASNPLDTVWKDRPHAPSAKVELFPVSFAGIGAKEKLDQVASVLRDKKLQAAVITLPDSIAWLLNIRSSDIPHIPVALSYAIVRDDGTLDWFIDGARVSDAVRATFGNRVSILPPQEIEGALSSLKGKTVLVDERKTSVWFTNILKNHGVVWVDAKDPVIALKARKNSAEQKAMRSAHVRDGVAVTKFLKWLSEESVGKTELDVEAKLEEFRRAAPEFRDSSFDTIAGFGSNGAIVHYRATKETSKILEQGNLLLLDSGAQYADGTTDITRTVAIGKPSKEMKEHFTLVLKGHIAVASAHFKAGTTGAQIDALARAALKERGLDYAHGTGHGVGCYLSVHEEAASLSSRGVDPVEPGMILSNEPGYYLEGGYGIRIENLILAQEDEGGMISFETLTFAPFDMALVEKSMLTEQELVWLAGYHAEVLAKIGPHLDAATKAWLETAIR